MNMMNTRKGCMKTMSNKWINLVYEDICHVIPEKDIREHECSEECWCSPLVDEEDGYIVYSHNSLDGREEYEYGRKFN